MKKKIIVIVLVSISLLIFLFIYASRPTQLTFTKSYNKSLIEGKIGDELIFNNSDVIYVGKSDEEANITSCSQMIEGYYCDFTLLIELNKEAGKRHSDITSKLTIDLIPHYRDSNGNPVIFTNPNSPYNNYVGLTKSYYLDKKFDIYLDGNLSNSLWISEDLKGRIVSQIILYGDGFGKTIDEALNSTEENMKRLQYSLM
ncbi:MAG: hypothetical protein Q7R52_03610 [archaeon]|nr:hypothetical protein [archaeon]